MVKDLVVIGFGGMLGSVARYLTVYSVVRAVPSALPLGTFVVNVTGCFIMGAIFGFAQRNEWLSPGWRFFLATGFCGGFTTFSAFAYENLMLLEQRDLMNFAANTALSVAACLAAVYLGLMISRI